ncbi:restriction endonuclease subunit S [Ochrobactrum sp. S46]|nr:restriction endonuclease subunit S [Ochrobactrum sp. S45]MBK0045121.1 restriction endonuclease subunit S [Ochrobactrum sp. S46]
MTDFQPRSLGDVVELKRGYDLPARLRSDGPYALVSSSGLSDRHVEARVKGPGVVTGRYGTIGQVFFVEGDFWPLNTTLYVRDFKGNDPRFIFYFLQTLDWQKFNDKSGVPGVNRNDAHREPVLIPDPVDQRAIAKVLGSLDDKIELNRRMNETLEAMAQSIFRDWFVEFGPSRRKMEGATDPITIMGGLVQDTERAQALAELFPATLRDDGLPVGWEEKQVGDVTLLLRRGLAPSYSDNGILVINQKCIRNRAVSFTAARRHDAAKRPAKDRLLEEYDVVVNSTGVGTLGRVATARGLKEAATADSHVTICRADTSKVSKLVLSLFIEGQEALIETLGHGSTGQTELSPASLSAMVFPVAPEPVQLVFESLVMPLRDLVTSNSEQSLTLAETRDLLLPKLMSGEICLSEAEVLAEPAH